MTRRDLSIFIGVRALCGAALLAAPSISSAASNGGTTGVPFLRMEQGARPMGMGGAFAAVADDANSLWWNPAGAASSKLSEATLSYASFIEQMSTQYIGFTRPMPNLNGSVGASLSYLNIPGIDGFDASGNPTGAIVANDYALGLAYASALSPNLALGANAKVIREKLDTNTGTGFALDLGGQYRYGPWGAGLVIQNMGPSFKIAGTSSALPLDIRGGVAYAAHPRVLLALDEEKPRDANLKTHLGIEGKVTSNFRLRTGYEQVDNAGSGAGFTIGFSVFGVFGGSSSEGGWAGEGTPWWERVSKFENSEESVKRGLYLVSLDYAFMSFGNISDTHRVTVNLKF